MRMSWVGIALLAGAGCGGDAPTTPPEAKALLKMVRQAEAAGFERHDLDKFLAIWADDAKKIEGRTETPTDYDTVLTRAQFEAKHKLLFAVPPEGVRMEFENERVILKGDEATVRYRSTTRYSKRTFTVDETYRLRRQGGEWKVYENRSWPVEASGGESVHTYDAATWKALDEAARTAAGKGDLRGQVKALLQGLRSAAAHAAAKKWTEEQGEFAESWVARGLAAVAVGDMTDAKASFKKALELDPKAPMPDYARAAAKEK